MSKLGLPGPKTAQTSSFSFLRSRPWSTKTQVSCLPTALASMAARTDESTPPDRAHSTLPSPICSRRALTLLSTKESIFQSPEQPHTLRSEEHTSELQSRFERVCRLL